VLDCFQEFELSRSALDPDREAEILNMAWRQLCLSALVHGTVPMVSKANVSSKTGVWLLKGFHQGVEQIC